MRKIMFFNNISLKDKLFSTLFIDIRGEVIRLVQGRPMDNNLNFTIDSFGTIVLPGHLGYNVSREQLSDNVNILKEFLQQNNMKAVKVVAGLGQAGVITRSIQVPKMIPKDLDGLMKLNSNDYLPLSPEEYAFDYKVLGEVQDNDREFLEVMVAAVSHRQVEQCTLLLEQAGLKPLVFDILPNMLLRLFGHLPYQDNMVVDGGMDGTHLAIFKGKNLFMYADIPIRINLQGNYDFTELVKEMSGYMDYFSSRNFGKTVDGVTILGELVYWPELVEVLEQFLPIPITVGLSQAGHLNYKGKATDFYDQAAVFAGNLGLMMRESYQSTALTPVTSAKMLSTGVSPGA